MLTTSNPEPRYVAGESSLERTKGFVNIQTAGVRELAKELERRAGLAAPKLLMDAVVKASKPIAAVYAAGARQMMATGGLAESVRTFRREYRSVAVAVTGPLQTGNKGTSDTAVSGNHAWIVEFGTGRRSPGTQGRRTYINVHQMINRKMKKSARAVNDDQFRRMGSGYYFLMGSINEKTRQSGGKPGYSKDFMLGKDGRSGEQHPITLKPGESIAPMPATHLMEKTIQRTASEVQSLLIAGIQAQLNKL
jgi:hypothetical protein